MEARILLERVNGLIGKEDLVEEVQSSNSEEVEAMIRQTLNG
jgi:hypothetical protein